MTLQDDLTIDRPKGRRAQAKLERRQTLLDATIDSIAEYGLSGTTIARVTEIAGTSIGLANFYFENKERLFEAVLHHLAEVEREMLEKHLARAGEAVADRLIAQINARFDARVCNPRTLAVWFAFWGDAAARTIYRRVVQPTDDARLALVVPLIRSLSADDLSHDAYRTALGMEAFYDGLWLNMLLYPDDFSHIKCRARAVEHLVTLFPEQFESPPTVAGSSALVARKKDVSHGS